MRISLRNKFRAGLNLIWPLIFLLIPTFIFLLSGITFLKLSYYNLKHNIAETFLLTLCFYLFVILIPITKVRKYLLVSLYIIIAVKVFIQVSYYNLYPFNISASTIFILIESNLTEALEYSNAYLNEYNLFLALILFLPLFGLNKVYNTFREFSIKNYHEMIFCFGILLLFGYVYSYKNFWKINLYGIILNSFEEYEKQTALYDEYELDKPTGQFSNVVNTKPSSSKRIFVLIIGESTTRHHMGLYGYSRQTNPMLSKIKNELSIFKDVISPHTHTIMSLSKIMSLNNYEDNRQLEKGSLIQLMNQGGFNTYWISNQRPVGLHENLITKMAQASDNTYFLNTRNFNNVGIYDDVVLPPLAKVLNQDHDLFIVIHLLGTHSGYKQRYPPKFEFYREKDKAPLGLKNDISNRINNEYDNAVLYNDSIVYEIIELVKKKNNSSFVLYLSDHGEDVYQVSNMASHTETMGTYPMYDVPFVLWTSPKFKSEFPREFKLNRKYMLDDFIYSIADLTGVEFETFKPNRSIFSESFVQRSRIIHNNKDYDSIFEK